jgi:hypothetical protein
MLLVSYISSKEVWQLACPYAGNAPVSDPEGHVVR